MLVCLNARKLGSQQTVLRQLILLKTVDPTLEAWRNAFMVVSGSASKSGKVPFHVTSLVAVRTFYLSISRKYLLQWNRHSSQMPLRARWAHGVSVVAVAGVTRTSSPTEQAHLLVRWLLSQEEALVLGWRSLSSWVRRGRNTCCMLCGVRPRV